MSFVYVNFEMDFLEGWFHLEMAPALNCGFRFVVVVLSGFLTFGVRLYSR